MKGKNSTAIGFDSLIMLADPPQFRLEQNNTAHFEELLVTGCFRRRHGSKRTELFMAGLLMSEY